MIAALIRKHLKQSSLPLLFAKLRKISETRFTTSNGKHKLGITQLFFYPLNSI